MKQKPHALAGIMALVLFTGSYYLLSNARPEFSHFTKAVSELGSVDAPNAVVWNIFGYLIPGLLVAYFGIGLHQAVTQGEGGKLPLYGMVLSGLFMAMSGVFPGDFGQRDSTTMLLHTIGSIGSFVAFLLAAFSYPPQLKKIPFWEKTILPSLLLTWLCIFSGFLRTGAMPGIGQRFGFAFYFLWIGFMAVQLYRYAGQDKVL